MRIEKAKIRLPEKKIEDVEKNLQRVSNYTESYKGEYYNIEISNLIPFKNQPRKIFDQNSLEELASTIKTHGIRQPLTILPSSEHEGKYEIISGERRWRAAQIAGMLRVPCIIIHDQQAAEEIALIENVQRKNLHPLELMHSFQSLLDRKVYKSTQEIAKRIGVSKSVVVECLSLRKLPNETKNTLLNDGIKTRKLLRQLVKSSSENHNQIISDYKKGKISSVLQDTKVLTISLKKGKVFLKDNNFSSLKKEEKLKIKEFLVKCLQDEEFKI